MSVTPAARDAQPAEPYGPLAAARRRPSVARMPPAGERRPSAARDPRGSAVWFAKRLLWNLSLHAPSARALDPARLLKRAKRLKAQRGFRYARQLLAYAHGQRAPDPRLRRLIGQQYALCTSKDVDLPSADRLERAVAILEATDPPDASTDAESLGIAGGIYKREWEATGAVAHLERSLGYYRRGYELGRDAPAPPDDGYTGINAAFVLDLLAREDEATARGSAELLALAERRRAEARAIRVDLLARLAPLSEGPAGAKARDNWWYLVTVGEAALGVGAYRQAAHWLRLARAIADRPGGVAPWEYETTARQLAKLARLQHGDAIPVDSDAWRVLAEFLGDDAPALRSAVRGKVGLALSGGGFRASLFHIGVLARLAETDVLRHVEVLSCVSGGSILGAHYYLLLRQALGAKGDALTHEDYVRLVERLADDFLAGVGANIRTRALAECLTSLQMIFRPHYTRTRRLGELYEKHIYARVKDGDEGGKRWLDRLFISPADAPAGFTPKDDNWRRRNKVPMLVLNATTLNTGHNWQFTASWMGEPPTAIDREVDGNDRYRRMYYAQAPAPHDHMRLGHAVAASACVPGLFEPLTLAGLYVEDLRGGRRTRRTVRLADGGVHDNQGVASLLEQDCTVFLVSDASGQMDSDAQPRVDNLGSMLRSNSILMERVRVSEFHELATRQLAGRVQGLMFLHLKKDLDVLPVNWMDCDEPPDADSDDARNLRGRATSYGVRKDVQERLAAVRTDLDSFSEAEAYALMLSGYKMAASEMERRLAGAPGVVGPELPGRWKFRALDDAMARAPATPNAPDTPAQHDLLRLLAVSKNVPLKVWRLPSARLAVTTLLAAAALALLALGAERGYDAWLHRPLWRDVASALGALAALSLAAGLVRLLAVRESFSQVATGVGLGFLGVLFWPIQRLHLHVFDPIYQARGRAKRVLGR